MTYENGALSCNSTTAGRFGISEACCVACMAALLKVCGVGLGKADVQGMKRQARERKER